VNAEAATIAVTRHKGRVDRLRSFTSTVDDEPVGRLKPGSRLEHPIRPGAHKVEARIDWASSPALTVSVAPGETIELECVSLGKPLSAFVRSVFNRHEYLELRQLDKHPNRRDS
jgi:hypothetical protein